MKMNISVEWVAQLDRTGNVLGSNCTTEAIYFTEVFVVVLSPSNSGVIFQIRPKYPSTSLIICYALTIVTFRCYIILLIESAIKWKKNWIKKMLNIY
jgi:hypothetical protein